MFTIFPSNKCIFRRARLPQVEVEDVVPHLALELERRVVERDDVTDTNNTKGESGGTRKETNTKRGRVFEGEVPGEKEAGEARGLQGLVEEDRGGSSGLEHAP